MQEELGGHPIFVGKTVSANSTLCTETHFIAYSTAWPPSLWKFHVC